MTDVPLFPTTEGMQAPAGDVEQAYAGSVEAAELEPQDAGLAALAVALARGADFAGRRGDVRGLSGIAKELREVTTRLKLDPTARGAQSDPLADLLAKLNETETVDEAGGAPVGDPANT